MALYEVDPPKRLALPLAFRTADVLTDEAVTDNGEGLLQGKFGDELEVEGVISHID